MRIAYGYDVKPEAFAHAKVERTLIDVKGSGRKARGQLLQRGYIRPGDVIVLVKASHLGKNTEHFVTGLGVRIEVSTPVGPMKKPGAPMVYAPNAEQEDYIKSMYLNPGYRLAYVLAEASIKMGHKVERHHLVRAYGNRYKRPTEEPQK